MIQGLVALLNSDSAFTSAMGGNVYPMLMPEGTSLGTTFRIIGGASDPGFTNSGPQRVRIEFDCYAQAYALADTGRTLLRTLLEGYVGQLTDGTYLQNVQFIQPIDHPYDYDAKLYRLGSEYYVFFNLS